METILSTRKEMLIRSAQKVSKVEAEPPRFKEEDLKELQKSFVTSHSRGSRVLEALPSDMPGTSSKANPGKGTKTQALQNLKRLLETAEVKDTRGWVEYLAKEVEKYKITEVYDFMHDGLWIDARKKVTRNKGVCIDGPTSWTKYVDSFCVKKDDGSSKAPDTTVNKTAVNVGEIKDPDELEEELLEQLERLEADERLEKKAKKLKIRKIHERLRNLCPPPPSNGLKK